MKIIYSFLPVYFLLSSHLIAQDGENLFYENYEDYLQESIETRRFKHNDIVPIIKSLEEAPGFDVKKVGESVQDRDIFLITVGKGETSVLLWSQMHGDETTATRALLDIFNFFKATDDGMDSIRQVLINELTIHFIPLLNPDGAEVHERRNAQDFDINRDALRLQSPEAKILKSVRDSIDADFGFNLHDQSTRYTAGKSNKPATLSFLAPAYDYEKSVNEGRANAMKLIVDINNTLQNYIPGQVAKYSDEHEPRAFGDNIQKWGTNVVLIESGGYKNDPEKQYIRKLNFVAILQGLLSIATGSYAEESIESYYAIPDNANYLYDLIIREALVEVEGEEYMMDLGINRSETDINGHQDFYYKSSIQEVGDMSVFYGYEEIDAIGMKAVPGKIYPETLENIQELKAANIHEILSGGYTTVRLHTLPSEGFTELPLNIVGESVEKSYAIEQYASPNFVLKENGNVRYAIVNGFIYNVGNKENKVKNALVE